MSQELDAYVVFVVRRAGGEGLTTEQVVAEVRTLTDDEKRDALDEWARETELMDK